MNRRKLLAALLGSATAAAAGELLIPTRKIFLPPRGGWGLASAWDSDVYQYSASFHRPLIESVWTFEEPPPAGALVQLTFGEGTVSALIDGRPVSVGRTEKLVVMARAMLPL